MTLQEKRATMRNIVASWQESGLTQVGFAKAQSLTISKFRYWIQRVRQETEGEFIQLRGFSGGSISVRFPNGVEVDMPVQTPVAYLKTLITF